MSLLLVQTGASPTPTPIYGFRIITPDVPDDRGSIPLRGVVVLGLVVAVVAPPPAVYAHRPAPPTLYDLPPIVGQVTFPPSPTLTATAVIYAARISSVQLPDVQVIAGRVVAAYPVAAPTPPPVTPPGGGGVGPGYQHRPPRRPPDGMYDPNLALIVALI